MVSKIRTIHHSKRIDNDDTPKPSFTSHRSSMTRQSRQQQQQQRRRQQHQWTLQREITLLIVWGSIIIISPSSIVMRVLGIPQLCSDGITEGYSTYEDLKFDLLQLDSYSSSSNTNIFTICPHSILQIPNQEPIGLPITTIATTTTTTTTITIQCGSDGVSTNDCSMIGSGRYLQIGQIGRPPSTYKIDFELKGVTIRGDGTRTDMTSIWIDDSAYGNFKFIDCSFEDIDGRAGARAVIGYFPVGENQLTLRNCHFKRNKILRSVVDAQCWVSCPGSTEIVIDGCTFVENENTYQDHGCAIHAPRADTMDITSSCFVRNKAVSKSIVQVYPRSNISQHDNYSHENQIPEVYRYKDTCDGIFVHNGVTGWTSYETNYCHEFEATRCALAPTSFPVIEPPSDPECIDVKGWVGCDPDCYMLCPLEDDGPGCYMYDYEVTGMSAEEACCGCGGGIRDSSTSTTSPPEPPPITFPPNPLLCSDGVTEGYSTFEELKFALMQSDPYSGTTTFSICPHSKLEIPDGEPTGLLIYGSTIIQCGNDGSPTNDCSIVGSGRYLQFGEVGRAAASTYEIDFEMKGVRVRGGARTDYTSVWIDDSAFGNFVFTDCTFEDIDGLDGARAVIGYYPVGDSRLTLKNCHFQRNKIIRSVIDAQCIKTCQSALNDPLDLLPHCWETCGGTSNFVIDGCTFVENENAYESQGGVIHASWAHTMAITKSCFVRNKSMSKSIVQTYPSTTISQDDNYSLENQLEVYRYKDTCDGIFAYSRWKGNFGEWYENIVCYDFEATSCAPAPSSFPVIEPPPGPECIDYEDWLGCNLECYIKCPLWDDDDDTYLCDETVDYDGVRAEEACCGCGGGIRDSTIPPQPPPYTTVQWQGYDWINMATDGVSVSDGILTFLPGPVGRKHVRLSAPVSAPLEIVADFINDPFYSSHYIMLSTNPDFEYMNVLSAGEPSGRYGAVFFEYFASSMYLDVGKEGLYFTMSPDTCIFDNNYKIHISVNEEMIAFENDQGCANLTIPGRVDGYDDPLYVYLGASSDYGPYNISWVSFDLVDSSNTWPPTTLPPTTLPPCDGCNETGKELKLERQQLSTGLIVGLVFGVVIVSSLSAGGVFLLYIQYEKCMSSSLPARNDAPLGIDLEAAPPESARPVAAK